MAADCTVERGRPDDELAVRRLLDGAVLAFEDLPDRLAAGRVIVARRPDGTPIGAALWEGAADSCHITAIAVHPSRRGQGIGRTLVTHLLASHDSVTARFGEQARPFYEHLGFDIRRCDDGRFEGELTTLKRDSG